MNIFFGFTGELVKEEGHTGKEHHYTVNDGVKEQKSYLCFETLDGVRRKVCRLDIADDGIFTVENKRGERACDGAADKSADADNEGE